MFVHDRTNGADTQYYLVCQWCNVCWCLFVTGLMELIHKSAFRDTLGHSLYMAQNRIGSFTPENVRTILRLLIVIRYVGLSFLLYFLCSSCDQLLQLFCTFLILHNQFTASCLFAAFIAMGLFLTDLSGVIYCLH